MASCLTQELSGLIDQVTAKWRPEVRPALEALACADVGNLDWYLRNKIVDPQLSEDEVSNHRRVLRYAYNFVNHAAKVTLVREGNGPSPDLMVSVNSYTFYCEVKKFQMQQDGSSRNPVMKIVDAITNKMRQLIAGEMNLVAINNFDLGLESNDEEGLTHAHIWEAIEEIERLANGNTGYYSRLSGLIFSAHTSGGALSVGQVLLPDFVWVNKCAEPGVPKTLETWLVEALPGGKRLE